MSSLLGGEIADATREAFVHAMSRASIVAALVALLGAFIAWRHLPARGAARQISMDGDSRRVLGDLVTREGTW